ncbi:MAG: protein kinase domain-containing protein, partial [Acidobacteriota bacterium]
MLTPGTRLGAQEVIALVGAGGMGEVYRARDTKLNREVAVKVLPAAISQDADALARFEREARAVAALNHPNILSIFDFGTHDGTAYAVMELLEGKTLRQQLEGGPLAPRRAIEIAIQIARGLAAAHGKGVVHRDLKPENVFLTDDGRVKILDFGLAKQFGPAAAETIASATPSGTEPGTVLGTVGYMSPEQVRGREVDARSDIFSFGALFYEMLSGRRAFKGDSAVETMSAILKEEPPDLAATGRQVPAALDRVLRHCLEKSPAARFQSASDIAFDLEALSSPSQSQAAVAGGRGLAWRPLAAFLAVPVLVVLGFWAGRRGPSAAPARPTYQQMTFQRGTVLAARFAPDGDTIVYGAAWAGRPFETFSVRAESQLARPLGVAGTVLAVSNSGQLALSLGRHYVTSFNSTGTLAVASLSGGAPREMLEGVEWADWGPDGQTLAIVHRVEGTDRLEYPVGKSIFQTAGWLQHPRVSPRGDAVAFIEHPSIAGDNGWLIVVDRAGKQRAKSELCSSIQGLAWASGGSEVWFTGSRTGGNRWLWALDLAGHERL